MDAHLTEWLNLAIRWVHMIVGIAWIGASFYFVWLENNLDRRNPGDGLAGELWAIHGGGIYHLEKYRLAPPRMPERLHWFKWEAYSTWLSGIALLLVVYYLNPGLYLLRPGSELDPPIGVALACASLIVGWFVYDLLCDSPLGRQPVLLGLLLFALVTAAAWGYAQVFSGRAAYIHTGALIGTLMVGNVLRVIMPAQRALVAAIEQRHTPDPRLPAKGLLRSRHNNYLTLPVLFIMISNHFPSTYGSSYSWAILAALAALSVLVRHYFNTRHGGPRFVWALPAAALGLLCLALITAPNHPPQPVAGSPARSAPVVFADVSRIIEQRCHQCHAAQPSSPLFSAPPAGVAFDSPAEIRQHAARIHAQAVASQVMPLGNTTGMTQHERDLLGAWIARGAPLD